MSDRPRPIKWVQFGALSASEWEKYAVEITRPSTRGGDLTGTPYDERLGVLDKGKSCLHSLCGRKMNDCPGHFGYVKLEEPVFNSIYLPTVIRILKCVCKCSQPRIPAGTAQISGLLNLHRSKRLRETEKRCSKISACSSCGSLLYNFEEKNGAISMFSTKNKANSQRISAKAVLSIFKLITDDTMKLLGFNEDLSTNPIFYSEIREEVLDPSEKLFHIHTVRPEALLFEVLPVPPPRVRPWVVRDGEKLDDDLTDKINSILKINLRLKEDREKIAGITSTFSTKKGRKSGKLSEADRQSLIDDLQLHVWTYVDNRKEMSKLSSGGRAHKGIADRIIGKEGRVQSNVCGKRTDFSGRTVIIPGGPLLRHDEFGVPRSFASVLTVPEPVSQWNLVLWQKEIDNGNVIYVRRFNKKLNVQENINIISATKNFTKPFLLEVGDTIETKLRDGHIIVPNRQPTLRVESMMGARVKIIDDKAMRIPLSATKPFNADCDGDEMNIHVAQSFSARAECSTVMEIAYHIVSPQHNSPVMGPIQNGLLGAYLLTNEWKPTTSCHLQYEPTPLTRERDMKIDKLAMSKKGKKRKTIDVEIETIFKEYAEKIKVTPFTETFIFNDEFANMIMAADISMERYNNFINRGKLFYPQYIVNNKLTRMIPGKLAMSIVFPPDFSFKRKTDVLKDKPFFLVEKGIILPESGPMEKKSIGIGKNSVIHVLYNMYSPSAASQFISEVQFIADRFMPMYGVSMGISDCLTTSKTIIAEALSDVSSKCAIILNSNKSIEDKEREVNTELNGILGISTKLAQTSMNKDDRNGLIIMKKSGAKGNDANNGQISAFVGQQNVNGKRMPLTLCNDTRALPHFEPGDNSPEARGMIYNNYLHGLTFYETFFHAAAGRIGVIDTAVKTAESGYLQKKLTQKLGDFKAWIDGSVRDANGSILQFVYGGDGFNPRRLIYADGIDFPFFVNPVILAGILNNNVELDNEDIDEEKRELTPDEINLLAKFISAGIPSVQTQVMARVTYNMQTVLRVALRKVIVYPSQIPIFCKRIRDAYETSKIAQGEAVGMICSSSIGETTTQLVLNVFHSTGIAAKDVTLGLPRLKELLHVTEKPARQSCTIYYKNGQLEEKVKEINKATEAKSDEGITLEKEIKCIELLDMLSCNLEEIDIKLLLVDYELKYLLVDGKIPDAGPLNLITYEEYTEEWWVNIGHEVRKNISPFESVTPEHWVINLIFNQEKLYEYRIDLTDVALRIEEESQGTLVCVPSPNVIGRIEVYLKYTEIKEYTAAKLELPKECSSREGYLSDTNMQFYMAREVALDVIRKTKVSGVSGIKRRYSRLDPKTKEPYADTSGSNLLEILKLPHVDTTRTTSDNVWEVYTAFGIEAGRNLLIKEITKIICFDGLYINQRHFQVLVDSMTRMGTITAVNRDGIGREVGPVAKALFEKNMDNFAEASIYGEMDPMKGVASAVMFGTQADNIGTGAIEIKDPDALPAGCG